MMKRQEILKNANETSRGVKNMISNIKKYVGWKLHQIRYSRSRVWRGICGQAI